MAYATTFAHVLFAGTLVPSMAFYLQQQVLNTRRQAVVPLVSTIVGTAVNVLLSLYFLRGFTSEPLNATDLPLGNQSSYLGAAIARGAGAIVMVIIVGAYMILSRDQICPFGCLCCSPGVRRQQRGGRRKSSSSNNNNHHNGDGSDDDEHEPELLPEAEQNFWAWEGGFQLLLALCGPSMLLMISEWWGFEALAIMAGNLPDGAACLDANGVLYNINLVMYMIYRGFGVGTSVYVGNSIGRKCDLRLAGGGLRDVAASFGTSFSTKADVTIGDGGDNDDDGAAANNDDDDSNLDDALVQAAARDAKTFCWTGLLASIVVQLLLSTAYYFLREQLASIFTDDPDVVGKASNATIAAATAAVGYAMVMPANMVRCLRTCTCASVPVSCFASVRACSPASCARVCQRSCAISSPCRLCSNARARDQSHARQTLNGGTVGLSRSQSRSHHVCCVCMTYVRYEGAARPRAPDGGRGDHHVRVLRCRAADWRAAGLHRQDGAKRHLVGQRRGAHLVGHRHPLVRLSWIMNGFVVVLVKIRCSSPLLPYARTGGTSCLHCIFMSKSSL